MANPRLTPIYSQPHDDAVLTDEQFRRFAAGISSIVWRTNFDASRLAAPRWAEITGVREGALQQNGWLSTVHPDDRFAVADALRSSRVTGAHFEVDFRICLRKGDYHWFRSRGEPLRNGRGEPVGMIGIASNIDGQKRAEAALVENESRLRCIVDAARVGTIDHDLQTGRITCSDLALRLLDFDSHVNLTFEKVVSRVHPADRATFARAAAKATATGSNGILEVTFRAVHMDGTVLWVSSRGTYLFEGSGADRHAVRFIGVVADLGTRVRDLEERARLSAIVSSSNDAIIAITTEGTVTHWNAAAERTYGFTAAEMIGRQIAATIPSELLDDAHQRIQDVAGGKAVSGLVAERVTKGGRRIQVSLTLSPIYDDLGTVTGVSSIVRDITEQVELQAEFVQAQKMEAIGQLAGGVAHDINNMLTAMLVGIELACQSTTMEPETRTYFDEVRDEGLRAAALIRQLLVVARRQVINPRPSCVNEIIGEMEPMITRLAGESIALVTNYDARHGAFVDPTQMSQVILNLAVNARDAMPNGGRLAISTRDDIANERVVIRIEDTGCGMTPEVQARLFEPFFTTKAPGVGTGLGLSTTYGIIAQSGGSISVQSKVGIGSVFTIAMPSIGAPEAIQHYGNDACGSEADAHGGSETILVVEDDRLVRDSIVRCLGKLGYFVLEACNGRDALIVLRRHSTPVHLILSDVVMPEVNGVELATYVRAEYPAVEVLLMSGYSEHAVRAHGVNFPDVELMAKPIGRSDLAAGVRAALDRADTTSHQRRAATGAGARN